MRCYFSLIILQFFSILLYGQNKAVTAVPNIPSREVYDLLRSRNGYMFFAHNAGVSRYDGRNIVSYVNRDQNGRGMTDLCEDREGRIWCHNFEGQIFFIQDQALHLFTPYRFDEERRFPRTGIFKDEIVATSSKGLFVAGVNGSNARYIPVPAPAISLSVLPNGVLVQVLGGSYYWYQQGKTLRELKVSQRFRLEHSYQLQPEAFRDTAFLICAALHEYRKVVVRHDSVVISSAIPSSDYINAVTVDGDDYWVQSYDGAVNNHGEKVPLRGLTNICSDMQGHRILSSLRDGLMVLHKTAMAPFRPEGLEDDEQVCAIQILANGEMLLGTTLGNMLHCRNGTVVRKLRTHRAARSVTQITRLDENRFFLTLTNGLCLYDMRTGRMHVTDSVLATKELAINGNKVYIANAFGVSMTTIDIAATASGLDSINSILVGRQRRCRSVCFGPDNSMFSAYSDGLVIARQHGENLRTSIDGGPIYATAIRNFAGRVLIGSFNRGLLLYERRGFRPLTSGQEDRLNSVPNIRVAGDVAWVLYDQEVLELDKNLSIHERAGLPFTGEEVYDIAAQGDSLLVATTRGLFYVQPAGNENVQTRTIIDFAGISNKGRREKNEGHFAERDNVVISLSTPWYASGCYLRYRYRLSSGGSPVWQLSEEDQTSFSFINLAPGNYMFEAQAVNPGGIPIAAPVHYSFSIDPPWYQTTWARIAVLGLLLALFYFLGRVFQRRAANRERRRIEQKLALEQERIRISTEIHDDLGAHLSGVRLHTELLRDKMMPGPVRTELELIHGSITQLNAKIREVIWSLNVEYDSVESLIAYIEKRARTLFAGSRIRLLVDIPEDVPSARINGTERRQIYLAAKEALHSVLKHSSATRCWLRFGNVDQSLVISITDDGQGINASGYDLTGSGMSTMQRRMENVGGRVVIDASKGLQVQFIIPLIPFHEARSINS